MIFGTDEQTILDLNIFPKLKGDSSVFSFYNSTTTKGGRDELEQMLRVPMCNLEDINYRISTIKFISDNRITCNLDNEYLDFIEFYINHNTPILHDNFYDSIIAKISYEIKPSNEYYIIQRGLEYLRNHLLILSDFFKNIDKINKPIFFDQLLEEIERITDDPELEFFIKPNKERFTFRQINRFDFLIRKNKKEIVKRILDFTYELDVYMSVSDVSKKRKLGFPVILKSSKPILKMTGFFHPLIENPIKNDLKILDNKNFCFVSGANMSGKSTFLKTAGLCVYLAHIGFPVPAKQMEISLFNGLYSTINISDSIHKGYSHYYSEVKRVKDIALMIKEKRNVMVIFDELFRGTNVKDAFDATLMVSKGFSKIKESLFFVSTHIVELGEELEKIENIDFKCFKSSIDGDSPYYSYKLVNGISNERLGLEILKKENIMDIIKQIIAK